MELTGIKVESLGKKAYDTLAKYEDIWSEKLGQLTATEHHIRLNPDTVRNNQMPYRQGPEMRPVTQEHIDGQLEAGVIEPANSEWASTVGFAPKKDGKLRLCIDYRRLNQATIADTYHYRGWTTESIR